MRLLLPQCFDNLTQAISAFKVCPHRIRTPVNRLFYVRTTAVRVPAKIQPFETSMRVDVLCSMYTSRSPMLLRSSTSCQWQSNQSLSGWQDAEQMQPWGLRVHSRSAYEEALDSGYDELELSLDGCGLICAASAPGVLRTAVVRGTELCIATHAMAPSVRHSPWPVPHTSVVHGTSGTSEAHPRRTN
eukprot:7253192-Prymnesium_polylepis.1